MKSHASESTTAVENIELHGASNMPQAGGLDHQKASWGHLFSFTKRAHVGAACAALVSAAITAGFKTVLSVMLGKIFDIIADFGNGQLDGKEALSDISRWCLILVALGIGNWLASTAFLVFWITFGELQASSVRNDIFESLISRDMSWFDSQTEGISSLLVRIQTQTRELQLATSQVFGHLVNDMITSLASIAIALSYSWKLTLVLLATLPVSAIILSLATHRLEPAIQAQKRELATASKHATASITAIDLVKVFNGYNYELRQYYQAVKYAARHYLVQAQCNAIQIGYVNFWVVIMFVVGFWYGVVLVNDGLKPGAVLTTFYATLASFQGIEALMPHWLVLAKGMSAGAFLSTLKMDSVKGRKVQRMKGLIKPTSCIGDIELTNVSFAYPSNPNTKVLNRSSFFFPAGEVTFLVGRSGSGKSTLGNLIVGFYEPTTGQVQIDGHPVQTLDRQWIRENVTLIQQSSILFNDTFFKNVAFGHPNPDKVTREEVLDACEAALLQSTLAALPQGLDTNVGSEGYNLSGGQKQRLALARARLRDSPVLILDEVTSGLDLVSKMLVMEAIREWRQNKTTIIITHDVSQIGDDDFVYVMNNAALVQEGFRRDLSRDASGHFACIEAIMASGESETPIGINAIPPTRPASDVSASNLNIRRPSLLSQLFVGELERNALRPGSPGLPQRTSLGAGTAYAFRLMTEQMWDTDFAQQPLSRPGTSAEPFEEKGSLWQRLSRRYSSATQIELNATFQSTKQVDASSLSVLEGKYSFDDSTDEPSYVFGGADRRHDITNLRVAQPSQSAKHNSNQENSPGSLESMSLISILQTVWPALGHRDRFLLLLGLVVCVLGGAASPAFSYCFAQLLGAMWSPGDKLAEGKRWAIYLVAIAIADGLCAGGGRYLMEYTGQAWVNTIRVQALERILQQPKRWFERPAHSAGRINECLDRNAEEMRNIVGRFIPIVLTVVVMILMAVTWALAISWKLTLVSLAPLPVIMGAVKGYSIVSGKWEANCNQGAEDASATLTEIFLNVRVVKALTLEAHFRNKYLRFISSTLRMGYKRAIYTSPLFGMYQSLNYPMTALVFYYGTVLLAREQEITATAVLQVVNLLLFSMGSSTGVLSSIPQITMAQATATQMLTYANMPMQPPSEKGGPGKPTTPLPVRFNDLAFSYSPAVDRQILRRVSFEVRAGDCLAIVGHSGCGKSTVISLLLGLYVPSPPLSWHESPLTFSGMSYADIDVSFLRSTMAYVPQAPFLFPATIAENIAYGLDGSSPLRQMDSITAASRAASLHDFIISLPDGYHTIVGDGGQALSGGQSQRLSIARALIRKPKLLIMDEPTSALDAESSEMIRQTIQNLAQQSRISPGGLAIVVVTHSREMMKIADRIVVLEDGTKVEEGTYDNLMRSKAQFTHLVSGGEWVKEGKEKSSMAGSMTLLEEESSAVGQGDVGLRMREAGGYMKTK